MKRSTVGAVLRDGDRCRFRLWAPRASRAEVHVLAPGDRVVPLEPDSRGYHETVVDDVAPGTRYLYRLDGGEEYPDPASRFQPEGVHGPSEVVATEFDWTDGSFRGVALSDFILYELHVGTFTDEGTFDAAVARLAELRGLGVSAVELMPVAQFPGERNWGYDGVYPFAVQSSYGGPSGLKRFVDACHAHGLSVVLDVVYNHLGPEGNYFEHFAPYFTERYRTPWGKALNFDGPESDEVRRFFIDNALYWIDELHIDALRLDAVHAILDASPYKFLEELADSVRARARRRAYLIPESASNDVRLIRSREVGGYGLDAQWNDDFHHALRVLLTGERGGYYQDYGRGLREIEKSFREGFVYSGEYSPYRRRRHGTSSAGLPAERFVVFSQNHDQVGNRMHGDRLSEQVCLERLKLAAATSILSPFLPLLFMGEEYGEIAPFPYFVSHSEPELIDAVRRGRKEEFAAFEWSGEPPDPQDEQTFVSARLQHHRKNDEPHRSLLSFYRALIDLRTTEPALHPSAYRSVQRFEKEKVLVVDRSSFAASSELGVLFHFGSDTATVEVALSPGRWRKRLDSAAESFRGPGGESPDEAISNGSIALTLSPWSALVLASTVP